MKEIDKILINNLKSEVDNNFSNDTMLYIKNRRKRFRIGLSLFLLAICSVAITFIPFESIKIDNLPYIDKTFVISKVYVFVVFTFAVLIFFDTIFRSLFMSNQYLDTTN
jgi:hypothetical protein